jgi:hypothetical protein
VRSIKERGKEERSCIRREEVKEKREGEEGEEKKP